MRKNLIEPKKFSNSAFTLQIQIEMADKEDLTKLNEILEENSK